MFFVSLLNHLHNKMFPKIVRTTSIILSSTFDILTNALKNPNSSFPLRSFPNRISKSAKTWPLGRSTSPAESDFCHAHIKVIFPYISPQILTPASETSSEKDCLNQPQMPAQPKKCRNWKKHLKHAGNPRCCDFRICISSKRPSHPNSPSPETSCFSNTCCGHCINARAAAKCAFGAWQQFSDFQKMHQQHPISKPSKESKSKQN